MWAQPTILHMPGSLLPPLFKALTQIFLALPLVSPDCWSLSFYLCFEYGVQTSSWDLCQELQAKRVLWDHANGFACLWGHLQRDSIWHSSTMSVMGSYNWAGVWALPRLQESLSDDSDRAERDGCLSWGSTSYWSHQIVQVAARSSRLCQGTPVVVLVSWVSESHDLNKGGAGDLVCRVLLAEPTHRQAVSDIYIPGTTADTICWLWHFWLNSYWMGPRFFLLLQEEGQQAML
jgi:hypothetical protein